MSKESIIFTGATGFLGNHLLPRLKNDFNLVLVGRRKVANEDSAIESLLFEDLLDPVVIKHLQDIKVSKIVHLASVTGNNYSDDHNRYVKNIEMMEQLIDISKKLDIKKFVFVSSNAVNYSKASYATTKWEAEKLLKNSGLPFVIYKPVIILGKDSPDIRRMTNLFLKTPVIPLIKGGRQKIQPIYVEDVADYLILALTKSEIENITLNLAGSQVIESGTLVRFLLKKINTKRLLLPIDGTFYSLLRRIISMTRFKNQVLSLETDLIIDLNELVKVSGKIPLGFDEYSNLIF